LRWLLFDKWEITKRMRVPWSNRSGNAALCARACLLPDLRRISTMASLIPFVLSGYKPCGLMSFTDPSWRHFDTHNSRVLRLGSIRLWNFWQKPRCVAVTDSVLTNNSTAAVRIALISSPTKLNSNHHWLWGWSRGNADYWTRRISNFKTRQVFLAHGVYMLFLLVAVSGTSL